MTALSSSPGAPAPRRVGHLVIVGGNEEREGDMQVLRRFVELTGRPEPRVLVLGSLPSADPSWKALDSAFAELGVAQRFSLPLASREACLDPKTADHVRTADGIYLHGVDAQRLMALLGGTLLHEALMNALQCDAKCVAGTGAGASVLSQYVMFDGRDAASLGAGLGLVQRALIDQRFSERRRLGPLLALVARNRQLIGLGIDEDTALVIEPGGGIEVVGDGAVTLIDGREMATHALQPGGRETLELVDVKLHLLPTGASYTCDEAVCDVPAALKDIVTILTTHTPAGVPPS
jgi:cyanophycinase